MDTPEHKSERAPDVPAPSRALYTAWQAAPKYLRVRFLNWALLEPCSATLGFRKALRIISTIEEARCALLAAALWKRLDEISSFGVDEVHWRSPAERLADFLEQELEHDNLDTLARSLCERLSLETVEDLYECPHCGECLL
ncbi:MAG: hypothetical protein AAF416_15865 [Pseudomonadota bacterium]